MDIYEESHLNEYHPLCIPAVIGGTIGFLSPMALVHPFFIWIPFLSLLMITWGAILFMMYPSVLSGKKIAVWGFFFSLFFSSAALADSWIYKRMDVYDGQIFAGQWLDLMLQGREKEACQLGLSSYQRAKGRGIDVSYASNPVFIEAYKNFQTAEAPQYLLKEFCGGRAEYVRLSKTFILKKQRAYIYEFNVVVGEGLMQKSRPFFVCVECNQIPTENRYEWRWVRTNLKEDN
ncbi:MAG: hypothetical protein Q4C96_00940 [Planctomycetia bacterium]|nr:hypothetical protein [Planctomycetia bacterium]